MYNEKLKMLERYFPNKECLNFCFNHFFPKLKQSIKPEDCIIKGKGSSGERLDEFVKKLRILKLTIYSEDSLLERLNLLYDGDEDYYMKLLMGYFMYIYQTEDMYKNFKIYKSRHSFLYTKDKN